MTTTPDERALRRAVNANPADTHARLLLAEELQEQGRDCEAAVERIVAQPWCDDWRLQLADVAERNGQREYAEFVHVQLQRAGMTDESKPACTNLALATTGKCNDPECPQMRWLLLQRQLQDDQANLLGGYPEKLRRGPRCDACDGTGRRFGVKAHEPPNCPHCEAGDAGGLSEHKKVPARRGHTIEFAHKVAWRRGCPERVECRLEDVVEQYENGRDEFGYAEFDWRVTDWAKRVVRWHAVLELWVTDRNTHWNGKSHCWYSAERPRPSDGVPDEAELPAFVFRRLGASSRWEPYETPETAKLALAVKLALIARESLLEGE